MNVVGDGIIRGEVDLFILVKSWKVLIEFGIYFGIFGGLGG